MVINESLKVDSRKRLSDILHDILKKEKSISMSKLLKELKSQNIFIEEKVLDEILSKWDRNTKYNKWLDYYSYQKRVDYKLKKKKPKLGKHRKKLIDKEKPAWNYSSGRNNSYVYNKKEENEIPIPDVIMDNIFDTASDYIIGELKKQIKEEIDKKNINNTYEEAWEYLMSSQGYKKFFKYLKLNKNKWKSYYEPSEKWKVLKEEDIDLGVRVLYYKYGYGTIDIINNMYMFIDFDDLKIGQKSLKIDAVVNNKSMRILEVYQKKDIWKNPHMEILYLNEVYKNLYLNKTYYHMSLGEIKFKSINKIKQYISYSVVNGEKNIRTNFYQFLTTNKFYKRKSKSTSNELKNKLQKSKEEDIKFDYDMKIDFNEYEFVKIDSSTKFNKGDIVVGKNNKNNLYFYNTHDEQYNYYYFKNKYSTMGLSLITLTRGYLKLEKKDDDDLLIKCNPILVKFFKENDIYDKVITNCKSTNKYWRSSNWGGDLPCSSFNNSIISLFDFKKTPEGEDFWFKINDKYFSHYIKNKSKKS